MALLSGVLTRVVSLRFSAEAGTTLHRSVKLAAGANDVTTADNVICAAGLAAAEFGETAMTLMVGFTTPGGDGGLAVVAAGRVTSRLVSSTGRPALLSVAASAAGLLCTAPTVFISEVEMSAVSALTANARGQQPTPGGRAELVLLDRGDREIVGSDAQVSGHAGGKRGLRHVVECGGRVAAEAHGRGDDGYRVL